MGIGRRLVIARGQGHARGRRQSSTGTFRSRFATVGSRRTLPLRVRGPPLLPPVVLEEEQPPPEEPEPGPPEPERATGAFNCGTCSELPWVTPACVAYTRTIRSSWFAPWPTVETTWCPGMLSFLLQGCDHAAQPDRLSQRLKQVRLFFLVRSPGMRCFLTCRVAG